MKFRNFSKVLCLSPHPDDVEYSMGAIILQNIDTKFDILCLSLGGDKDETTGEQRLAEAQNAWDITYSSTSHVHIFHSGVKLLSDRTFPEWINYIETEFLNVHEYDCIMVPSEFDSHFEHILVSSFAAPLARVKPLNIIQYKSPSTLDTWIPNLFVSIWPMMFTHKKKMLKEFKSQQHHSYFNDNVIDGFHTNFQCMKKGKGFVEQFKIITSYE